MSSKLEKMKELRARTLLGGGEKRVAVHHAQGRAAGRGEEAGRRIVSRPQRCGVGDAHRQHD